MEQRQVPLSPHRSIGRELHAPKTIHTHKFDSSIPPSGGGVWRRLKNHPELRTTLGVRPEERKQAPHFHLVRQPNLRTILRNIYGFRRLLETIGLPVSPGNDNDQTQ